MLFEEQPPPPGYERLITRLWYLDAPRNARYEKILPLPLVHLIVNLSDPYRLIEADGRATVVDGAFVAGLRTHYLISELPDRLRHAAAEFTPAGLDALTTALGTGRAGALAGGRVLPAAGLPPARIGWPPGWAHWLPMRPWPRSPSSCAAAPLRLPTRWPWR